MSPGPGKDMYDSTRIIAKNQYQKAKVTLMLQQVNFQSFTVDVCKVGMNPCMFVAIRKHKSNNDLIFDTNHFARSFFLI